MVASPDCESMHSRSSPRRPDPASGFAESASCTSRYSRDMWMPRVSALARSTPMSAEAGTRCGSPPSPATHSGSAILRMPTQSSGRAAAARS